MKNYKIAIIGLGNRSLGLYNALKNREYVDIVALCDLYEDRCEDMAKRIEGDGRHRPLLFDDYKRCIDEAKPDMVVIATSWLPHVDICIYAMERGVIAASEVGGAYTLEECYELVRTYEETQTPFAFMENCCFNNSELLATAAVRAGALGQIVHCSGAYGHDLRQEVSHGNP